MTASESLIICGDCRFTHSPVTPPTWTKNGRFIDGLCHECGETVVRIEGELDA